MQVNMLEAKNQLSKLVKAAVSGEEVIIANHGEAQVRLVPCVAAPGLRHWGVLAGRFDDVDAAFGEQADAEVAELFKNS
ncbi:type II toxin-antitoxin system prevent-host-death family antitoxin [Thiococcus pfennigii]|uniref:type II toxin-antitoxin system prevent-host-death family antitoxin n=1 Tax=Thiococcus pfennigii TaxID=1057 RepID=UPI0019066C45|nr:type II toxin-antitoxin system prevent-host-death family antitoxin [Thiococcus pfennigii]MBK1730851.1 type II toxin-antitoxin system prevent-host-death family antitoxin [Thiococcus pfennigii]